MAKALERIDKIKVPSEPPKKWTIVNIGMIGCGKVRNAVFQESFVVKTVTDILTYLKVRNIEVNPLGSTEANVGIERGILSLNLGRTYGRYKHSLNEEAEIEGSFLAMK